MNVGVNILIGCLMVQIISSCVRNDTGEVKIAWQQIDLPKDRYGQPHAGLAGPIVGVTGPYVWVGGGANFPDKKPWEGGQKQYHDALYLYHWDGSLLTYQKTCQLPLSIAYAACCSDGGKIYVAGGENDQGLLADVYAFRIGADLKPLVDTLPSLPEEITNASLTYVNDILYLIGGDTKLYTSDRIFKLELNGKKQWELAGLLPQKLSHTVSLRSGDNIYIIGGRYRVAGKKSPFSNQVYLFNTKNGMLSNLQDLPEPIAAAVGIPYKKGILLLGGDNGQTYHQVEDLILQASAEREELKQDHIIQRKNLVQVNHPGFSNHQLIYHQEQNRWERLRMDFPYKMPVTTTAIALDSNFIVIPSGEVRAGVRTDKISIGEIKVVN